MRSSFTLARNILIAAISFSVFVLSVAGVFRIADESGYWVFMAAVGLLLLSMVSVFVCSCAVSDIISKGSLASPVEP